MGGVKAPELSFLPGVPFGGSFFLLPFLPLCFLWLLRPDRLEARLLRDFCLLEIVEDPLDPLELEEWLPVEEPTRFFVFAFAFSSAETRLRTLVLMPGATSLCLR